jgi:drug/metabolite transporter superfamily protein YnfA
VYVATAVVWLWAVDGQRPDRFDLIGAAVCWPAWRSSTSARGRLIAWGNATLTVAVPTGD